MRLILLSASVSLVGEQSARLSIVHSLPAIQPCMHEFKHHPTQYNCTHSYVMGHHSRIEHTTNASFNYSNRPHLHIGHKHPKASTITIY